MKNLFINLFVALLFTGSLYANDVYVTQSGNTLDLDITQDGQNNTVGNSTTASTVTGATTTLDIDQVPSLVLLGLIQM